MHFSGVERLNIETQLQYLKKKFKAKKNPLYERLGFSKIIPATLCNKPKFPDYKDNCQKPPLLVWLSHHVFYC